MPFDFKNLDARTRKYMLEELESDISAGTLYSSNRFSEAGDKAYPDLMREAIQNGDDASLAQALSASEYWKAEEPRTKPKITMADTPVTRAETFAEGQFNRYYTRGLCLRAIDDKVNALIIYRAKAVDKPRPDSEDTIGSQLDPQELLDGQRARVTDAHKLAWKPNSGLSVHLPE